MTDMQALLLSCPLGDITIELNLSRAPKTAGHFLDLAKDPHFAGAHFYRVVRAVGEDTAPPTIDIIQGGVGWARCNDMPGVDHEPTSKTGLAHLDGAISMARSSDTPANSEFFICIGDQTQLDAGATEGPGREGFAVFGRVVGGMDVVRAIHQLPADGEPPGGDERFKNQFLTDTLPITGIQIL